MFCWDICNLFSVSIVCKIKQRTNMTFKSSKSETVSYLSVFMTISYMFVFQEWLHDFHYVSSG